MIYTPREGDAQLLSFSRELVRDALNVLRDSERLAYEQRTRDELAKAKPDAAENEPA